MDVGNSFTLGLVIACTLSAISPVAVCPASIWLACCIAVGHLFVDGQEFEGWSKQHPTEPDLCTPLFLTRTRPNLCTFYLEISCELVSKREDAGGIQNV